MKLFLATWREPGELAVQRALAESEKGAGMLDCLEAGLAACEMEHRFLAIGVGALPNSDGDIELDAAIMDGHDLSVGAVCALRGIAPAIAVARHVKEHTPHVMIAGDQARRFALERGFHAMNTATPESIRRYEDWKAGRAEFEYVHATDEHKHGDTVTMLGFETTEAGPRVASASSTSGLAWKIPGRVGDSPIVGAGIYADDEAGAAGATGLGEELWKACASFRTVEAMRRGMSATDACVDTIRHMIRRRPATKEFPCVVIAVDRSGGFGAATTKGEFHLWSCKDGTIDVQAFHSPA